MTGTAEETNGAADLAPPRPLVAPPVVPPPLPRDAADDEDHRAPVAAGGTALAVAAVAAAAPVMVLARSGAGHGASVETSTPVLYDGDADATVDELAALAQSAPADPPSRARPRPRPPTPTAASPVEPTPAPGPVPTAEPAAAGEPPRAVVVTTDAPDAARGRRRAWPWLLALFVLGALAALGYVAYRLFRTPTHEVPALVGLTEADVTQLTEGFDWEIDTELARSDEEPDPGEIIRTSPAAGEQLAEGEPFLIVISEGPELRVLPELAGRSLSDAETALAELRLVALPAVEAFDEEVPEGDVISWSVADDDALVAGDEVLPDTEVELVVSDGPEPRVVPDVGGAPIDDVTAQLEDLGLVVTVTEPVFSDTVPDRGPRVDRAGCRHVGRAWVDDRAHPVEGTRSGGDARPDRPDAAADPGHAGVGRPEHRRPARQHPGRLRVGVGHRRVGRPRRPVPPWHRHRHGVASCSPDTAFADR